MTRADEQMMAPAEAGVLTLTIDGQAVSARQGQTVLAAALEHRINIPHLCYHPELPAGGSCRLCIVEIDGVNGFPTSCTTPAVDGMVVRTDTPQLRNLRRIVLELLLVDHPTACLVCDKQDLCLKYRHGPAKAGRTTGCNLCSNKDVCDVRDLAKDLGLIELTFPPRYRNLPLERSDPFIDRDYNLCILCGRCVRVCKAGQGEGVVAWVGRGANVRVGTAFEQSLVRVNCCFCGSCVDVCPTGALSERYGKWRGQADQSGATFCIFCPIGCPLRVEARGGKVLRTGGWAGPTEWPVCVLGRFAVAEFLNGQERLVDPLIKRGDSQRRSRWEDALKAAAEGLMKYRGESLAVVADASSSLEVQYVLGRLAEAGLGGARFFVAPHNAEPAAALPALRAEIAAGRVKAAYLATAAIDPAILEKLEFLVVQDCYPSAASRRADVVLPAAVFSEVEGTWVGSDGWVRRLRAISKAPGRARPELEIAVHLSRRVGIESPETQLLADLVAGLDASGVVSAKAGRREPGGLESPLPALDLSAVPKYFRGHRISQYVPGLAELEEARERAAAAVDSAGE